MKEPLMLYGRETLYLSVPRMVGACIRQSDKSQMIRVCEVLLSFCFDKGLLKGNPFDSNGVLLRNYEVYERHLTETGKHYFNDLMFDWFAYTDRTNKIDHVKMLEKWYHKMTEHMDKEPKILTSHAREGDVFYFRIGMLYYFLQIVKVVENESVPQRRYQYFVVVFHKAYRVLPHNIAEMDLQTIYQIKYKPAKTLLFLTLSYETPELKIMWFDVKYGSREKYDLIRFGHRKVEGLNPDVILKDVSWTTNEKGILISPTAANTGYIFDRIEQDEAMKLKKQQKISPVYFRQWLGIIDPDAIVRIEKLLSVFETDCATRDQEKSLKKCVLAINKLDEKYHFIMTAEAGDIYDKLVELSAQHGLEEDQAVEIIGQNRNWKSIRSIMKQQLIKKLRELEAQEPEIPPVVTLDEYFTGNTDEECIAWNQVGYGRPSLAGLYRRFKEIQQKDEVQTVLVGLHFDWAEADKRPESWPSAENIHIYASVSMETVEEWVDGMEADGVMEGWPYGEHPSAPEPGDGFHIYTVCWD